MQVGGLKNLTHFADVINGWPLTVLIHTFQVRQLVEIINSGTQPIQNLGVFLKARQTPEDRREWCRYGLFNTL